MEMISMRKQQQNLFVYFITSKEFKIFSAKYNFILFSSNRNLPSRKFHLLPISENQYDFNLLFDNMQIPSIDSRDSLNFKYQNFQLNSAFLFA